MLVGALGDAFEPFVDAYLPALLKNTVIMSTPTWELKSTPAL